MSEQDDDIDCDFCGERIQGRWLYLSRFGFGSNAQNGTWLRSIVNAVPDEDGDDCEDKVRGNYLCWPSCAQKYLEYCLIEADLELRRVAE